MTDTNESRTYIDTQLEAPLYHPQAACAVRRAGSDAVALDSDASANLTSHRGRCVPQKRCESAVAATAGQFDCLLLAADAPSTSAEGGDVCSVRTGLYRAVS